MSQQQSTANRAHGSLIVTRRPAEKAFLVAVELRREASAWDTDDSLEELAQLARTAGAVVVGETKQHLESPHPATYIGKGKVEEIRGLRAGTAYDLVIFDDELSPSQQRNLEDALGVRVLDRTGLILDIFAQRARTYEGRLQVELAQYQYFLPRLTRLWTHLSRQTVGGVGLRGPGETQLESDRRRIRNRIGDLRRELEHVRRHRALYRFQRKDQGFPVVALVGYTNAGKSTLLNALTGAEVLVEDRLFATLDPTTRRVELPNGQTVLLTDTVGFIQKLPAQVVAAFRATLEELEEADVLLHVLDITHRNAAEQHRVVLNTLKELGLSTRPIVTALSKVDRLVESNRGDLKSIQAVVFASFQRLASSIQDTVAISAEQGYGLEQLKETLATVLARSMLDITVCLPYQAGELVTLFHQRGTVRSESHTKKGTLISGRIPPRFAEIYKGYAA